MSDRPVGRPADKRPVSRRDPNEITEHVKNQNRSAIDQHLRDRDRTAAARERTLTEAQTRSRARASGDAPAFTPRNKSRRSRNRVWIILASLVTVLLIGAVLLPPLAGGFFRSLAEANPDLMRIGLVADSVAAVMDDRPDKPAGTDPTSVEFVIEDGQSSAEITQNLVNRQLVTDRLAFTYVLVNDGGLGNVRSGTHMLNRTMSPREVAAALQGEPTTAGAVVPIALREGLRLEQVVAYLQTLPLENVDPEQFKDLATEPPAELKQRFPWLSVIPDGRSLEGFLGSGVINVPSDADAETVLEALLQAWHDSGRYDVMKQAQTEGKNFYEIVILASIVEREALHDSDKPLVAGVYQNRVDGLQGVRTLNSDPILIYANDTMKLRELHVTEWPNYVFWTYDGIGAAADFEVSSDLAGYQVWHSRGLPPGPIATPGVASLQAALHPDTQDQFLYFLGKNDGSGDLVFAKTYEEHLLNIQRYLGTPEPSAFPSLDVPTESPELTSPTPSASLEASP